MVSTLTVVFVILNTLISGLYFVFSNTMIPAFMNEEPSVGIRVMNGINLRIQNAWFLLLFFGAPVVGVALIIMNPTSFYIWIGALLHIIGSFLVTIIKNVPLNTILMEDPTEASWQRYVSEWTNWNTIRSVAGILATVVVLIEL